MPRIILIAALVVFVAAACGGKGGSSGYDTAEDLTKAVVKAWSAGDGDAAKALYPSDELLKKTFECKGERTFIKYIQKKRDKAVKEIKGEKADMEFVSFELKKSEELKEEDNCKAKGKVELVKGRIKIKIKKDGKEKEDGEGVKYLKIDGKYYLLNL